MPVGPAIEKWSGRSKRFTANGWVATRVFTVHGAANSNEALLASGLPAYNSSHPESSLLKVSDIGAASPEGPFYWEVTLTYSVPAAGGDHPGGTDPLTEAPEIEWDIALTSEDFDRDIRQNPIVNSARDAFDQGSPRDVEDSGFTIYRPEPFYSRDIAKPYFNTVNIQPVTIFGHTFDRWTLRCATISPTERYTRNAKNVKVAYSFRIREFPLNPPPGFIKSLASSPFQDWRVDQGSGAKWDDAGTIRHGEFINKDGDAPRAQVLLAGNGKPIDTTWKLNKAQNVAIDQGAPPGPYIFRASSGGTTTGYVLVYQRCEGANHNDLGLPT